MLFTQEEHFDFQASKLGLYIYTVLVYINLLFRCFLIYQAPQISSHFITDCSTIIIECDTPVKHYTSFIQWVDNYFNVLECFNLDTEACGLPLKFKFMHCTLDDIYFDNCIVCNSMFYVLHRSLRLANGCCCVPYP